MCGVSTGLSFTGRSHCGNRRLYTIVVVTTIMVYCSISIHPDRLFQLIWPLHHHKEVNSISSDWVKRRHSTLQERCATINYTIAPNTITSNRLIINRKWRLAMCYVPKAGCTFWKQVFYYLQVRRKENNAKNIFKDKLQVHYKHMPKLIDMVHFEQRLDFLNRATKMIFARDPYSRLFSAYVDKIVLPEFWRDIGTAIVKQTRHDPDHMSLRCGYDVTFEEFLRRVLLKAKGDVVYFGDEHWFPVYKLCLPCTYRYDIIGKQETFSTDRDWIVQQIGLGDILPTNKRSWAEEMVIAVKQSVSVAKLYNPKPPCSNDSLLMDRLWKSLKFQGYIHPDLPFSSLFPDQYKLDVDKVVSSFRKLVPRKHEFRERRKQAMVNAYRAVHDDVIFGIRRAFAMDLFLFDYDPFPEELFSHR